MRGRSAIGLSAILVLGACTNEGAADTLDVEMTTDATGATVSDTDHGLSAIVLQYREDEVRHVLSIKVRNAGPEPVRVVDLRLQWEGLEVVGPAPQDHLVGVGQALDLRTPYGDARCADDFSLDPPSTSSAFGEATIELSDGSTELVAIPIDDVEEQLVRLFRVDCRRQFIESVVTLELRGPWERVDPDGVATLRGALAVERRAGDRTITISDVDGSVLLDVHPAVPTNGPLLVLSPEDSGGNVPIDVTSARCDAHALGESKKTYVFQVEIDIGDGPEGVIISPPAATEPEMFQVIVDGCGL